MRVAAAVQQRKLGGLQCGGLAVAGAAGAVERWDCSSTMARNAPAKRLSIPMGEAKRSGPTTKIPAIARTERANAAASETAVSERTTTSLMHFYL